jgi:hypothetical protein
MKANWINERAMRAGRAIAVAASAERTSEEDGLRLVLIAMALGMMVAAFI